MAMSRDRVEFTLCKTGIVKNDEGTGVAASRAFGLTIPEANRMMIHGTRIRCRPSQFGRFIIYRVEEGVSNNPIQKLEPILVKAKPEAIDVSEHPYVG